MKLQNASIFKDLGLDGFSVKLIVAIVLLSFILPTIQKLFRKKSMNLPPEIPGFPFLGNLLQMTVERPHKMFTTWSEKYGPIYSIKTGETKQLIISTPEIAKEALVTKYASICNRSLGTNLRVLTRNKSIVAMADYGDKYRELKKMVLNHLLGQTPQKKLKSLREQYLYKTLDSLFEELKQFPQLSGEVNARTFISSVMFGVAMHQMFGREIEKINVPDLGGDVTKWEMYDILVHDVMKGAVQIDWRDFFPSLAWVPNKKFEENINKIEQRRCTLISALINQQKQLLSQKGKTDCYCDVIIENASKFSEDESLLAVWEPIIESSDTTMVTSEWALYELASNPNLQEKLYKEIGEVVGDRMVSEDDLPNLPFLNAVVKETLRKYSPVPILPPRYVHEQGQLGGYTIPAGYQIIVNVYGIHHDKKQWVNPDTWDPTRFLGSEKYDMGFTDMRLMPFGSGKRICAGITQAFYTIPMVIAAFIQHFEWSLPPNEKINTVTDTVYLTTQKLLPLQAVAKPRVPCRLNL